MTLYQERLTGSPFWAALPGGASWCVSRRKTNVSVGGVGTFCPFRREVRNRTGVPIEAGHYDPPLERAGLPDALDSCAISLLDILLRYR